MQPRFSSGSVWIPNDAGDWWEELKGEMLAFPHGVHDDLLDALAYIEQIAVAPLKRNVKLKTNLYAGSM